MSNPPCNPVFTVMHKGNRAKQAEMELDCHVSCVSDVLSYMMTTDGGQSSKPSDVEEVLVKE